MNQHNAASAQYETPTATPTIGFSTPNPGGTLPMTGFDGLFLLAVLGVVVLTLGLILFRSKHSG